jgi:hypothetical protein
MKKLREYLPVKALIGSCCLLVLILILPCLAHAQETSIETVIVDSSEPGFRTVIPGIEYKRSGFYTFFWGKHYRKEWTTPVRVPVINLDTVAGGLTATQQGGGRQTKTLRLKNAKGKEYVLRSVNKDYRGALPDIAWGTFVEDLAKDQVSSAHPFAAITVPSMIEAAAIYHTNPVIVFVPYTPSLGEYNKTFANLLCLFEERPDDDQSDAPNFGYSQNVVGTEKMFEKIFEENDHRVDQKAFVRARLFDMFLGDWGRHEDQWRWAKFDEGDLKIYRPIPRDRDQTWARFDGLITRTVTGMESLEHLQTFKGKIKNVKKYNFPARYLDRQLANEMPKEVWTTEATDLQNILTDELIETSIHKLPKEIFDISGDQIIRYLKSRREHLVEYAEKYYEFISEEVEIVGSENDELFQVRKINRDEVEVNVYDLNKKNQPKEKPFYSRKFFSDQTDEIRIYGLKGNDIYRIEGEGDNKIHLRIIGGPEQDSLFNLSASSSRLKYYDNPGNIITGKIRKRLSNDSSINTYNYKAYKYNEGSTIKRPYYSNVRGVHLQFGYQYTKQLWRKEPFGWHQSLMGYYSISNHSWGGEYEAIFTELIGKWNLTLNANYDQKLEQYFFGFGNNTKFDFEKNGYRYYTKEAGGGMGLNRKIGKNSLVGVSGNYQSVKILKQPHHVLVSQFPFNDPSTFEQKDFVAIAANYGYHHYNDEVVPTKGISFSVEASRTFNLDQNDHSFNRYDGFFGFYLPLTKAFSLAVRTGAATIDGQPEFYQLASLGGGSTLRGYFRQRFHGKTIFYNGADLRWIFNTRNYLFNGKMGLIAFFDDGRVWQPGDNSDQWHFGYGGGIMLAPFNKLAATVYYGLSEETGRFHIRLKKLF